MSNLFRNKIGGDKVISVYWFAIIVIVAGGVIAMVYTFYSSPYDVRELEGEVLANKVADCVSFQGKLNEELFDIEGNFNLKFSEDFFEVCGLNFETENENGWEESEQFFVEGVFYDLDENEIFGFSKGNLNLKADCFIPDKKRKDYEKLSKCVEKRIYSVGISEGEEQYLIKILVGVDKAEKNVKI